MVTRSLIPRRDDFLFPLEQTFDKFFDDFFSSNNLDRIKGSGGYPKMDVSLTEDVFLVQVAVPGSTSEDVKVEVTPQNVLVITGSMSNEYNHKSKFGSIRELRHSAFERHFQLPDYVENDPEAKLKDGMLTLKWKIKCRDKPMLDNKQIPILSD